MGERDKNGREGEERKMRGEERCAWTQLQISDPPLQDRSPREVVRRMSGSATGSDEERARGWSHTPSQRKYTLTQYTHEWGRKQTQKYSMKCERLRNIHVHLRGFHRMHNHSVRCDCVKHDANDYIWGRIVRERVRSEKKCAEDFPRVSLAAKTAITV